MSTVEDIERAVSGLQPTDLAEFRAWFETFEAERFDRRIEADIQAGKLDGLAAQAVADARNGRARTL